MSPGSPGGVYMIINLRRIWSCPTITPPPKVPLPVEKPGSTECRVPGAHTSPQHKFKSFGKCCQKTLGDNFLTVPRIWRNPRVPNRKRQFGDNKLACPDMPVVDILNPICTRQQRCASGYHYCSSNLLYPVKGSH